MDGKIWEEVIEIYLPKLENFKFRMNDELDDNNNEQQINKILNLFQSQFWLDKHQWFIRCDWNPNNGTVFLYSLPYAFDNFFCQYPILSKSTCPHIQQQYSYNNVHRLTYKANLSECWTLSDYQFMKIRELSVYFPINEYFFFDCSQT